LYLHREDEEDLKAQVKHLAEDVVPVGLVETASSMPAASRQVRGGVTVVATGSAEAVASGQRMVFGGQDSTSKAAAGDTKASAMQFLASTLYGDRHARAPITKKVQRKKLQKGNGAPAAQFSALATSNAAAAAAVKAAQSVARKRSRR
jgi:hypothetical protein